MDNQLGVEIRERSFRFACDVVAAVLAARRPAVFPVMDQLLKAGTSVGANLEEAKAASSRRQFVAMCEISLREARETIYWVRICRSLELLPDDTGPLAAEAGEIANILATIILKTKRRIAAEAAAAGAAALAMALGIGSVLF
jgi:four helix bundle protein